ncbi:hypothetical protein D3C85_1583360 [compost metagenome]
MVQWRQDLALLQQCRVIRTGLGAALGDFFLQTALGTNGGQRQFTCAAGITQHLDLSPFNQADLALSVGVFKLNQAHVGPPKSRGGRRLRAAPGGHSMMLKSLRYSSEISRPSPGLLSSSWM